MLRSLFALSALSLVISLTNMHNHEVHITKSKTGTGYNCDQPVQSCQVNTPCTATTNSSTVGFPNRLKCGWSGSTTTTCFDYSTQICTSTNYYQYNGCTGDLTSTFVTYTSACK